jgi:ADP-ribosylation factor-like protein 8
MGAFASALAGLFSRKRLELVLVGMCVASTPHFVLQIYDNISSGLENSGKTTLLNILASGEVVQTAPTIGLNVKSFRKGGVNMKAWDIGGQQKFRDEWGRYTRGCDVIVFMVDASDKKKIDTARYELHRLLENPELSKVPLLVLGNKVDTEPHMTHDNVIQALNLDYITENKWTMINISCTRNINLDKVVEWLTANSK